MADQSKSDMLMIFMQAKNAGAVNGESAVTIAPNDDLAKAVGLGGMPKFKAASDYDAWSNFFEVTDFEFSMELREDDEEKSSGVARTATHANSPHHRPAKRKKGGPFLRWRSATDKQARAIYYPLNFDKFSFTKMVDSASPVLFDYCANARTFPRAALVKRLAQGWKSKPNLLPGQKQEDAAVNITYLRMDFKNVMVTDLDWDDGDIVKEKCKFVCQELNILYRQQKFAGDLMDAGSGALWTQLDSAPKTNEN